jgi:hypothetical protein
MMNAELTLTDFGRSFAALQIIAMAIGTGPYTGNTPWQRHGVSRNVIPEMDGE